MHVHGYPQGQLYSLLVHYGVTVVFHAHDHLYAKQELDGAVCLGVPQPSVGSFSSGPSLATEYHYATGTILGSPGLHRITVAPRRVNAEYVRVWLTKNETAQRKKWSGG